MKKLWAVLLLLVASGQVFADEGMWVLKELNKQNLERMKELGFTPSYEQLYSETDPCVANAVVIFGGGCSGITVSNEGLIFTNHHCGFGSIQQLSSVEHDYLKDGFVSQSKEEELLVPGLTVRYLRETVDVSDRINSQIASIKEEHLRLAAADSIGQAMADSVGNTEFQAADVVPFYNNNKYFLIVYDVFNDVRMVFAPPSSVGKFGGDTDNWMWPRHTGDFSIFRVYAGADNRPAEYAPENRPYRAEKFLKISLDGVDEGDFAMVMGFPGSTERYMTSYEIDNLLGTENPQRIFIRGERQAILWDDMMADDAVRIQYASKYAMSSNYWKNSIGMSRGIRKLGVKARKEAQEASFQAWAEKNTLPEEGYIDALAKIREAELRGGPIYAGVQYLSEAFLGAVELLTPVRSFINMEKMAVEETIADPDAVRERLAEWYKDYNPATDRKVARRMLAIARENMKELPSFYADVVDKQFGGDIDAYVDYLYDHSVFASAEKVLALLDDYSPEKIAADPAVELSASVWSKYMELSKAYRESHAGYAEGHRKYIAGLMLQQPRKAWAPDANFTIRVTYGNVLPYSPADGIEYNYYTTLKGVMEKEDPKNPAEFTVPERLKELYAAKDFGRYANAKGEMPVAFLANLDITGGNSGSPVLNDRGALIGLAFDGNWEAMSGDVAFEPDLQRMIAVDVRYVLFIVDKFAGAGWLLDEMQFE